MNTDLSKSQSYYAYFLPALSTFYSNYVGAQQHDPNAVPQSRIPSNFRNGVDTLNYLNKNDGAFYYPWTLYSAGHADLDVHKFVAKESMVRERSRKESWVLLDSAAFQLSRAVWPGKWGDPSCPAAAKKRKQVLEFMDAYGDYGMTLDVPAWICRSPRGMAATGIKSYEEA